MRKKLDDKVEDGFISRWSKKKSQLENPPASIEIPEDNRAEGKIDEAEVDDEVLTDEDMPAVETLEVDSDYSGFLSPGVSDELRKLALRKLFRSQKFNVRDGLDDYDEDFRSFAALGEIITSDMKHQMELAEEKEKHQLAEREEAEQLAESPAEEQTDDQQQQAEADAEAQESADLLANKSADQESNT